MTSQNKKTIYTCGRVFRQLLRHFFHTNADSIEDSDIVTPKCPYATPNTKDFPSILKQKSSVADECLKPQKKVTFAENQETYYLRTNRDDGEPTKSNPFRYNAYGQSYVYFIDPPHKNDTPFIEPVDDTRSSEIVVSEPHPALKKQ